MKEQWHSLAPDEALLALNSRSSGLIETEAKARLSHYGPNELKRKKKIPPILAFLRQFLSPLIYVLLAAVIISFIVGNFIDAAVIMVVLLLNAIIGFIQETRAEKAMEALIEMAAPRTKVKRNDRIELLPAREVVPGDILLLETGDRVPADGRLIEASNLKANEAVLTGESMPVDKQTGVLGEELPVAERRNMLHMGTIITYGRAAAMAVGTGMSTEIGRIAATIQEVTHPKTPLQKSISTLSRYIAGIFLSVCGLIVVIGLLKGLGWLEVFLLAVAAAVSAIPEGLPAVVTVVLAIGMRLLARRNAIIRRLVAVETLGAATVICCDKTGTLTLNEITVRRLYVDGQWVEVTGEGYAPLGEFIRDGRSITPDDEQPLGLLLRTGVLCNDARLSPDEVSHTIYGDPTEGALLVAAAKAGITKEKLETDFPRLDEIPFQSERQYMATMHLKNGGRIVYIKGAVERLLSLSKYLQTDDGVIPLGQADIQTMAQANIAMAREAMRVIALAYTELPSGIDELGDEALKGNLVFVGLVGMADPLRAEAKEAVRLSQQAGIKVVMITGDHKVTAESIAHQLGLPSGRAVTGAELERMSDAELSRQVEDILVFARIEPLHKLRIIKALKSHGHIVAMTGDGVNDAPALKAADIGIAMGITGTDVAKENSDMILADDNFASIVAAVDEGRSIFNRLRNVIFFLLGTNLGELLALIVTISVLGKAPLLAVQILWVNLVTDTAQAIPLGLEAKTGDELRHPPRHSKVGLIFPGLLMRVGFLATLMGVGIFLIFNWAQARMSLEEARTVAFCSMVSFQWFQALNARSDERTAISLGIFRNRWLVAAILVAILLQLAVVYLPFLQTAFSTVPIGLDKWTIVILAGGSLFAVEETRKVLFPRLFALGKWRPLQKETA